MAEEKPNIRSWERVRNYVLKRDGYRCVECGTMSALEVHHLKALSDGGEEFDADNCIALCHDCHKKRHSENGKSLEEKDKVVEGESELDKIYRAEHQKRVLQGIKNSGKRGGRPLKEINRKTVTTRLNQGVPLTEIAAGQHMSVVTLKRRMREAKIKKKYGG